jgi:hypothetical protein
MSWRGRAGVVCGAAGLMLSALALQPAGAEEPSESAGRSGRPLAPKRSEYVLRSAANGTYIYREPGFSASIAADGTVTFHEASWKPQSTTYDILSNGGTGWSEVLATGGKGWDEQLQRPEVWPVPLPADTRPTLYDLRELRPDPMRPEIPVAVPIFADAGLRADLTDQYTRLMGSDPYGPQKAAFLASTFDMRMNMAAKDHRANVRAALDDLSRELQDVWGDTRYSVAERSSLIYLMWQDTSGDDPDARRARQIIVDFARRHLPPAEVARFAGAPAEPTAPPAAPELDLGE